MRFSKKVDPFPTGMIIAGAVVNELSEATIAAYDAPFPTEDLKVGRSGVLRLTCA